MSLTREPPAGGVAAIRSPTAASRAVLAAVAAAWTVMLGLILVKSLFVSHDSVSNYAHVWYVQDRIWHHQTLPFAMPALGHGDGLAYPYAFLPWTICALLWPLLGSWSVTLALVAGAVALIATTYWAFPELREGWYAPAALVNPALIAAPLSGQLPFIWAMTLLLAAVGSWRRARHRRATVLGALGQATHPAVVGPIALLLVIAWWPHERDRRRLARCYAISALVAAPAAMLVFLSPVVGDTSWTTAAANLAGTVGSRGLAIAIPVALVAARRHDAGPRAFVAVTALAVALALPLHVPSAVPSLTRRPDTELLRFIGSPAFTPGATYRIMRAKDGRVGMYQLLRHRARLDSEFFPESMARRSWAGVESYSAFLRARKVDDVIIFANYDRERRTNEHALLRELARRGGACRRSLVGARLVYAAGDYDVYRIRRGC
jgi:hypothetical protein